MIFDQRSSYYEILEVPADASAQDIRNAYQRLREAYRKDNLALYSVMDASETDEMQAKLEEAFHVLSDPESRRDYDDRNGIRHRLEDKIISIDRVPPMESNDETDLLIPPSTDFTLPTGQAPAAVTSTPFPGGGAIVDRRPSAFPRRSSDFASAAAAAASPRPADLLEEEISQQTEWRGTFLKRVREIRRFSVDDMATQTKISKTYIQAIEEESFAKLPAPVFVRGFVVQIAKVLKLPGDQVAAAYMARYKR